MFTEKKLQELVRAGKIRGYTMPGGTKPAPKASKYGNKKIEVDGIVFDSKKEAKRYGELRLLLKAGKIGLLRRQVEYKLEVNGEKVASYVADYVYFDLSTGQEVVEDVKSTETRKLRVYRLKKKLMKSIYGITIKEV